MESFQCCFAFLLRTRSKDQYHSHVSVAWYIRIINAETYFCLSISHLKPIFWVFLHHHVKMNFCTAAVGFLSLWSSVEASELYVNQHLSLCRWRELAAALLQCSLNWTTQSAVYPTYIHKRQLSNVMLAAGPSPGNLISVYSMICPVWVLHYVVNTNQQLLNLFQIKSPRAFWQGIYSETFAGTFHE